MLRRVNLSHIRLTVDADDAGDALGVVDLGDHVYDLARRVADGAGKVVNVVICACIALFFASQNSPSRPLVAGRAKATVVLTSGRFDVVRRARLSLNEPHLGHWRRSALRKRQNSASAVRNVRIDLQIGPIIDVCGLPLMLIAFKLASVANKRRFGG